MKALRSISKGAFSTTRIAITMVLYRITQKPPSQIPAMFLFGAIEDLCGLFGNILLAQQIEPEPPYELIGDSLHFFNGTENESEATAPSKRRGLSQ